MLHTPRERGELTDDGGLVVGIEPHSSCAHHVMGDRQLQGNRRTYIYT